MANPYLFVYSFISFHFFVIFKDIKGNTDPDGIVLVTLQYQVTALEVRIRTKLWVENNCIRMEFYGCESRCGSLVEENQLPANGKLK